MNDKQQINDLLDSYFRLTLRLDLDEDIPAAAEEIAALISDRVTKVEQDALQLIAALVELAGGAVTIPRSLMESMDRRTTLQRLVNPVTMATTYQVHHREEPV